MGKKGNGGGGDGSAIIIDSHSPVGFPLDGVCELILSLCNSSERLCIASKSA